MSQVVRESLTKKVGRLSENGFFKLYERGLIALGMPVLLAGVGWVTLTLIKLQVDVERAKAIQGMVLVPAVEQLAEDANVLARQSVTHEQLDALERQTEQKIRELRRDLADLRIMMELRMDGMP